MKKLVSIVLLLCLLCSFGIHANAAEGRNGSIEVVVKYEDTKVTGGELVAVRVGYVDDERNVFRNFITDSEITGIGEAGAVARMQDFYTRNKDTFHFDVYKAEVKNGIGKFEDIPLGLYLIYQKTAASGYEKLSPFLVTVPYDGGVHVCVTSKTELEREAEPTTEATTPSTSGGSKLPQTGQISWPIPWLAVTGMSMFVLGWWMCFGKKEDAR